MIPNNLQTLKVLSAQDLNLKIDLMKLDAFIQRFLPGQELSGQVIKNLSGNRSIVQFSGEQVLLEMDRPVRVGEALSVKVEHTDKSPVLRRIDSGNNQRRPSSNIPVVPKAPSQNSDKVQLQRQSPPNPTVEPSISSKQAADLGLKPGQKVEVTVSHPVNQTDISVKFINQPLVARQASGVFIPVKEGQVLSATVQKAGEPGQLFLVLDKPSQGVLDAGRLQAYLPSRTAISNTLSGLQQALGDLSPQVKEAIPAELLTRIKNSTESLVIKNPASLNGAEIKEQITKSGINYEAHLRNTLIGDKGIHQPLEFLKSDAKGQLMSLSRHIASTLSGGGEQSSVLNEIRNLAVQVRSAVQNIELQQLSQNLARQENQPLVLQIPNQLFGEDHTVKLFVRQENESSGSDTSRKKKSWNLVFFLDLTSLGSIRIDTKLDEQNVEVKISAQNEAILQFLEGRFSEFERALDEMGFNARISGEIASIDEMEMEEPLDKHLQLDSNRLVDIKT